jgi:uncharacterized membrane protein
MAMFASVFPVACWIVYSYGIPWVERRRPSLSVIMSLQRRRWVAAATHRETPMDAIISGNLMQSVSLLASTSVLLVLAIVATLGQVPELMKTLGTLGLGRQYTQADMQIHVLLLLGIFAASFFSFTLSLRQFNHFCIMIGAMEHDGTAPEEEIDAIARLNSLAAKNFNNGIRAYYFAVPLVAWFASDWLAIAVTLVTLGLIVHREFFSTAHRIAASVALIARRRDEERQT